MMFEYSDIEVFFPFFYTDKLIQYILFILQVIHFS